MHVGRRRCAALALAALTVGSATETARAGTAHGRPAQFTASAGERNELVVAADANGAVRFSDTGAPISAGLPWCVPLPLWQATCDPDGDPRDTDGGGVSIDLGDGDDRAVVLSIPGTQTRPGRVHVTGGTGNDQIANVSNAVVRFGGGAGDDTLAAGPAATAILLGGPGADRMQSDPGCCAFASYADHGPAGVRVTLDRTANDGSPGEGDDVRTSGVIGSPGPDAIIGDSGANTLIGSGGADVIHGGGGNDRIDATLRNTEATTGPDGVDTVTCGPGDDDVTADANDKVAVDCERVRVGFSGGLELALDMGARRASRAGSVRIAHRVRSPSRDNALTLRSTVRLVDREGRPASSVARFVLGGEASVAHRQVTLNRATRQRLARSRSGALALIVQRVSRDARPDAAATGYEQFNTPVTIRRATRASSTAR